jgi:hypothetical protein
MPNITIGRYTAPDLVQWSGWIEGETGDGTSWITFLDPAGRVALHWAQRDESGGVIGEPIRLAA